MGHANSVGNVDLAVASRHLQLTCQTKLVGGKALVGTILYSIVGIERDALEVVSHELAKSLDAVEHVGTHAFGSFLAFLGILLEKVLYVNPPWQAIGISLFHGCIVGSVESIIICIEHLHVLIKTGFLDGIVASTVGRCEDDVLVLLRGVERVQLVRDAGPLQNVRCREARANLVELRELVAVAECLRHAVLRSLYDMVETECLTVLFIVDILYE